MSAAESVPLDSASRVHPVHANIPEVKLPLDSESDDKDQARKLTTLLHPVTCQPLSHDELRANGIESVLRQFSNVEAAGKAREDSVKELRKLLDENEKKTKDLDREMEEKEKTREIERKVYARKLGKDG